MIARIQSRDFSDIIEAARILNTGALIRLKKRLRTIDIKDELGIATPAAYFASVYQTLHNDAAIAPEAIALLRKLGASDDYIAMGYAAAGNVADAEKLRKNRGVRLKPLAIGAAMAFDEAYAETLRQQFQLPLSWFIYGATLAGKLVYADTLSAKVSAEDEAYKFIKIMRLKAAKQSGQIDLGIKLNIFETDLALKVRLDTLLLCDAVSVKKKASLCKSEIRKEEMCVKTTTIPKYSRLSSLANHANMEEIVIWMQEGGYFINNEILTYEFAFINDEAFIEKLCAAADRVEEKEKQSILAMFDDGEHPLNFRHCQHQALLIRRLMKQFLFDYDQANAFLKLFDFKALFFHIIFKSKQINLLVAIIKGVTGLSDADTQDLLDKYFLFHAKAHTSLKLDNLNKKYGAGGLYSYLSQANSSQKLERVQSLLAATPKFKSFNELEDAMLIQHGLFAGTLHLEHDPQAPKHMQPLSNHDKTCELNPLVDELLISKYLDRNYMPRVKP